LLGALAGWWLMGRLPAGPWIMLLTALLLPLFNTVCLVCYTAIKSNAGRAPAMWWRALWGEIKASVRIFLFQLPWTSARPRFLPALTSRGAIPVLLVHGYICNHRIWDALTPRLRRTGHAVLCVNLEPLFTSIDDYAAQIDQAVQTLCEKTGASQVALVGHSMGGLAIRAWLRDFGPHRAARVITLGTPHAGTQLAPNTHTPNGRQMAWHSQWLQTLSEQEGPASRQLMRIALTPQDSIVFPQNEQVLPDVAVTVFPGLGHLELSLDRQVRTWLLQQLSNLALTGR
jgi:pimeloyl-ACP methyl ester carboxylesterase